MLKLVLLFSGPRSVRQCLLFRRRPLGPGKAHPIPHSAADQVLNQMGLFMRGAGHHEPVLWPYLVCSAASGADTTDQVAETAPVDHHQHPVCRGRRNGDCQFLAMSTACGLLGQEH